MKQKYKVRITALLTAAMLIGISLPATVWATEETSAPSVSTEPEGGDNTPVVVAREVSVNANYYADQTKEEYTIVFTPMDTIENLLGLKLKISMKDASVEKASFSEGIVGEGTEDIVRGKDYALYQLTYPEATTLSEKNSFCSLTVTAKAAPTAETLTISDFTYTTAESADLPINVKLTVEEGPIIPELDTATQAVYDSITILPDPMTLSFYQEDGNLTNLDELEETVNAVKTAYDALTEKQREDLDIVMTYYEKNNENLTTLPTTIKGMQDAVGLIEMAHTAKEITEENALAYQFLTSVYDAHKDLNPEGIPEDSTARKELTLTLDTIHTKAEIIKSVLETTNADDDACKDKTYACQDQLEIIQTLSAHTYYKEYLANLKTQLDALIEEVTESLTDDPIQQKALLAHLEEAKAGIVTIEEGIDDIPTMSLNGINLTQGYDIVFTRKSTLSDAISASVSVTVTDKDGKEIDTASRNFPANSKSFTLTLVAYSTRYSSRQTYTVTAHYIVNGAKFLIGSKDCKCTAYSVSGGSGLGNTNTGLGGTVSGGNTTIDSPTVGGGTLFPESNDTPEPKPEEPSPFLDIKNYGWAKEAIESLYEAEIINGMEDGIFLPAGQVTREQFAKMVVTLFDLPLGNTATSFADVNSSAWYAPYITSAVEAGYIQGQSKEYFGIGESIMRQDMATILYRAMGDQNSKAILDFSDVDDIASYATDAIAELVGLSIINGYEDGSFKPRGTATRAEAAKMIYGVYQYLNK